MSQLMDSAVACRAPIQTYSRRLQQLNQGSAVGAPPQQQSSPVCFGRFAQNSLEQDCVNRGYEPARSTVQQFESLQPARLQLHAQWSSCRRHLVNLTVVTTATVSRLSQLTAQCKSWRGPLIATVWQPLMRVDGEWKAALEDGWETLSYVKDLLESYHVTVESIGSCQMDLLLLHEAMEDELMTELMPINTARNYALLHAKTPLVAMLDVDLLISSSLFQDMLNYTRYKQVHDLCVNNNVVVLPAYETNRHEHNLAKAHALAETAVSMSKSILKKQLVNPASVIWFQQYSYKDGHQSTNHTRWYDTSDFYQVSCGKGYEPWFIVHRSLNPFYDQRFRGYGNDKISHVHWANATGFKFQVHPNAFVVHRPHRKSKVFWSFVAKRNRTGQIQQLHHHHRNVLWRRHLNETLVMSYDVKAVNNRFWATAKDEMTNGTYTTLLHPNIQNCKQQLPWWKPEWAGVV
eukprot:jgi/Chrzof1/5471/Cz16g04170.t1